MISFTTKNTVEEEEEKKRKSVTQLRKKQEWGKKEMVWFLFSTVSYDSLMNTFHHMNNKMNNINMYALH